jgi:hypothetical protein
MRGLSAADIVRVWERGAGQHPIDRALTILVAADPDAGRAAPGDLPLGERNRRLLAIRARTFGDGLEALAACVHCGERIELRVSAGEIGAGSPEAFPASPSEPPAQIRKLTSGDLVAAAQCGDLETARLTLAARAIERDGGNGTDPSPMPEAEVDAIAQRLHEIDPLAELLLDARCPACGAQSECELDVAEYVWIEIEAEALRVLRDVHTLAAAYGWRESDILAMSPLRRRAYLELVQ